MSIRVLVIEDEAQIARVLQLELEFEGYKVDVENNGKSGLEKALQTEFDLILLDVMLPQLNGIEVLRRIRKVDSQVPIILLTARNTTFDKVAGLDQGANDYITKPFEIEEVLARIRSCLRHHPRLNSEKSEIELSIGDLSINTETREVNRSGNMIALTPKEYDLLVYLMMNKNKVVTRDNILFNVWGYDFEGETNVIDVYIRHLRKKVDEGYPIQLISTVRGIGYTIRENTDEDYHKN